MKALLLVGSARIGGNTETLVKEMAKGLQKCGVATEIFNLAQLAIQPCLGCFGCKNKNETEKICVQPDTMTAIYDAIMESDILVLASPTYMGDITGQMKVFMDRCYAFIDASREKKIDASKKVGVLIAVGGAGNPKHYQKIIGSLKLITKIIGINKTLDMCGMSLMEKDDAANNQMVKNQAYALGMQAYQVVKNLHRKDLS